jgi:hypothetical protein
VRATQLPHAIEVAADARFLFRVGPALELGLACDGAIRVKWPFDVDETHARVFSSVSAAPAAPMLLHTISDTGCLTDVK